MFVIFGEILIEFVVFIKVICVGKLKHKPFKELVEKYMIQLNKWNVSVVEVKESRVNDVARRIAADEEAILKALPAGYIRVVMDAVGDEFSSKKFASYLGKIKDFEGGKICFVIGGPYGFSEEFKDKFDKRISFGKMTFTHEFVRVLLLEQVYRAFAILSGKSYDY